MDYSIRPWHVHFVDDAFKGVEVVTLPVLNYIVHSIEFKPFKSIYRGSDIPSQIQGGAITFYH